MDKKFLIDHLIRPHWKALTLALFAVIIEGAAGLLEPWPIKIALDYVIGGKPMPAWLNSLTVTLFGTDKMAVLSFAAISLIAIAALGAGASYLQKSLTIRVGQWIMRDLRQLVYHRLQRLSISFFDRARSGDLISRVTSDIDSVQSFITSALLGIFVDLLTLAGMLSIMFYLNWSFTFIALAVAPLLFIEVYTLTHQIKKATREVRKKDSEIVSIVQETLSSMRVVQAFNQQQFEEERLKNKTNESIELTMHARGIKARLTPVVDLLTAAGTCVVLWQGARYVMAGQLSSGELVLFLLYLRMLYKPMRDLSKMVDTASKAAVGLERIKEILNTESSVKDRPNAISADYIRGEITFENVYFGYDEHRSILKGIDLTIKPGQFAAFVGPTGAGKSTIINLISRFYDVERGRVLIDGVDVRDYKLDSMREQISFVLQDTVLFNTTIWENIAYGKPNATREEIYRAAVRANAIEFIEKLPKGFDTVIGERGVKLSGGQRQRIAIARAIVRNAPILVLDEPTSNLDAESEELVLEALGRLMRDRTTIVIAHRLSTIKKADTIFVVKDGEIVEAGNHLHLHALGGLYAHLYDIQTREEELQALLT